MKVERATGPFIERRTYKCSCGKETTEIVKHLLQDHRLTMTQVGKIAANAR